MSKNRDDRPSSRMSEKSQDEGSKGRRVTETERGQDGKAEEKKREGGREERDKTERPSSGRSERDRHNGGSGGGDGCFFFYLLVA